MREDLHGDVKPRFGPRPSSVPFIPASSIRRATQDDLFILDIARRCYPGRPVERAERWMRWAIGNPDHLVLVGRHSFGVASVAWEYGFERRAKLKILASLPSPTAPWEALKLLREMIKWSREQGALSFRFSSDSALDLTPFARRLGAAMRSERYHEVDF